MKILKDKIVEESTEIIIEMKVIAEVEIGTGLEKDHFGDTPDKLKEEYLDVYEGVQSEILSTTTFDENSDLSTTYLGKADRSKNNKIKAEESFPISKQGYTMGKLLDGT